MLPQTLSRVAAFSVLTCPSFAQAQTANIPPTTKPDAQTQQPPPASTTPPDAAQGAQPSSAQVHPNESNTQPPSKPQTPKSVKARAWAILEDACTGDQTSERTLAIRILGLITTDPTARKLAERALNDEKPEVRAAAAAALGDMKFRASLRKLRKALNDEDPTVALAAAHSLDLMHDSSAFELYYEILNGGRKAGKGLIAKRKSLLSDPKKMAHLGFEEGIGFIPFAGIGWGAIKAITKDDSSPIRAAAAKILARDPDPATTKALTDAVNDEKWLIRAAALEALAKRGNPSLLAAVEPLLGDEKDEVKYTAAAAVVQLIAIRDTSVARRRQTDR